MRTPFRWLLTTAACLSAACGPGAANAQQPITPASPVKQIQGGFTFTEGPAAAPDGTLYFTDIPADTIHVQAPGGPIEVFTKPAGHANGLWVDAQGRLLACQMDGRLVAYDRNTKQLTVLADQYEGKRFNAPNDLVVDAAGGIYFTDPLFRAPKPLPQGVQAVYYLPPDGPVRRVTDALPAPNGVGLSPDGKRLYVIPSQSSEMLAYPVEDGGRLGEAKVFCRLRQPEGKQDTGGDGMTVDERGNLYITAQIGVQIFDPSGKAMGVIEAPEQPSNVAFGGPQGKTLYITARTGLYAAEMPIAGLHP